MNYDVIKNAEELMKLYVKQMEKAVEVIDNLIPVVKAFDGKVLNKRFDTKLQEVEPHAKYKVRYGDVFTIEWYASDRFVRNCEGQSVVYFPQGYEDFTLCRLLDHKHHDKQTDRLKADAVVEGMLKEKEYWQNTIKRTKEKMVEVGSYATYFETVKKEVADKIRELPICIRDFYGLNYDVIRR